MDVLTLIFILYRPGNIILLAPPTRGVGSLIWVMVIGPHLLEGRGPPTMRQDFFLLATWLMLAGVSRIAQCLQGVIFRPNLATFVFLVLRHASYYLVRIVMMLAFGAGVGLTDELAELSFLN
ncbi:hypothetical protein VNO78_33347 [Psophocarpus tetragonolobus]|uniref:Uncharacterized protein n=1 Tax=Psophocarpus tetragonolobus TaxID=3891 RepID=A0AAN9P3X3_PSOTE